MVLEPCWLLHQNVNAIVNEMEKKKRGGGKTLNLLGNEKAKGHL